MLPEEDKTAKSFSCLYRACKSVVWTRYSVFEQVQVIIRVHVGLSYLEGSYILFLWRRQSELQPDNLNCSDIPIWRPVYPWQTVSYICATLVTYSMVSAVFLSPRHCSKATRAVTVTFPLAFLDRKPAVLRTYVIAWEQMGRELRAEMLWLYVSLLISMVWHPPPNLTLSPMPYKT